MNLNALADAIWEVSSEFRTYFLLFKGVNKSKHDKEMNGIFILFILKNIQEKQFTRQEFNVFEKMLMKI